MTKYMSCTEDQTQINAEVTKAGQDEREQIFFKGLDGAAMWMGSVYKS